jgi:hypothetical protein
MSEQGFDQWAVVEMLGHRRVIGKVTEQVIAGAGFIRVDVPGEGAEILQTQFVTPASIYAITPVSEDSARLAAQNVRADPITVWELPAHIRSAMYATTDGDTQEEPF